MLSAFFTGKSKYLLLSDFVIWKFSLSSKQSLRSILVSVEDFDESFNFIVYDFVPGNDEHYVSQKSKYIAPPKKYREIVLIPFQVLSCQRFILSPTHPLTTRHLLKSNQIVKIHLIENQKTLSERKNWGKS